MSSTIAVTLLLLTSVSIIFFITSADVVAAMLPMLDKEDFFKFFISFSTFFSSSSISLLNFCLKSLFLFSSSFIV